MRVRRARPAGEPKGDGRNTLQGAQVGRLRALVLAVTVAGAALLVSALLRLDVGAVRLEPALGLVCGLVLLTEVRPLFTGRTSDTTGLALSTAFVFAVLLRYGLPAAVVLQCAATLLADLSKRRAFWRAWFNAGQYTLSWSAAALVMHLAGHSASLALPLDLAGPDLAAAVCGAAAYFVCNELLVCRALSYHLGEPLRDLLRADLGYELLTTAALLALSPLVCLAVERGAAFVPLLLPPLAAVYAVGAVARDRQRAALTDALTGLGNRVLLEQRTAEALREGDVALVLFDLDRFKEVNDTLGHHVGDQLLRVVADRLGLAVRGCDTVARLGGDEFALVLPGLSETVARATAERLRALLAEPIVLEGVLVDVGASAGVAVSPEHGTRVEALLQHADVAMYAGKESGAVEVYDAGRDRNSTDQLALLGELRRALEEARAGAGQLELHYLPTVALADGRVTEVEALVRWRHPVHGLLLPASFLRVAERGGLSCALTAWVLDAALTQLAAWRAAGLPLGLSVNVGVQDVTGPDLETQVAGGLRTHALPASALTLELAEGRLLTEPGQAAATLRRLLELGVGLALDDFGTGSSGLAHLRGLRLRTVKVDDSLTRSSDDPRDLALLRCAVDAGRGLGLTVVAEGVEDAEALALVEALGCSAAQGRFLAPALPAAELSRWLAERDAGRTAVPARPLTA